MVTSEKPTDLLPFLVRRRANVKSKDPSYRLFAGDLDPVACCGMGPALRVNVCKGHAEEKHPRYGDIHRESPICTRKMCSHDVVF